MRNIAVTVLMSLLMITTALAGCMGDDEAKSEAIVGDWYAGEEKIITFNSDGTAILDGDEVVNWSIDGDLLNVSDEGEMYFHISDGWLFITEEVGSNCVAFSNEIIGGEDVFISATENLTLPSICGSLDYGLGGGQQDGPDLYQIVAYDHSDMVTNGTNDTLIEMGFAQAPQAFNWSYLDIGLFDGDNGVMYYCDINASGGNCSIIQGGSDNTTWEIQETIQISENGANMCEAAPCTFTVKVTDNRNGADITSTQTVVVE